MPRKLSLVKNIASLFVVQMASYAAPLVTLPWLTRILGPANFGRLSFCLAVTSYFVLIADYGFNLGATRQIALHSDNRAERSKIFWHTMAAKALLAALGFPLLVVLTLCGHRFGTERALLFINYLTVLGSVLTPTWYFMGTERQAILSAISIGVRMASIPAIFLLVRSSDDVRIAAIIPAGMSIVGGVLCLVVLLRKRQLDRARVDVAGVIGVLRDGWHLFLSTASISLYQATNTVLLGLVAGNAAVGHYAAAEKIVQACQSLLVPIGQSVFPRVSRLMGETPAAAFALIRRVLKIQGLFALMLSVMTYALAPTLIRILFGPDYEDSIRVLRWLAALPLLVGLSNVFGVQTMLAMGLNQLVSRILVIAGAINVLTLFALAQRYGAVGAAMAVVGTELFVTVVMAQILSRRNLPIFRVLATWG